jgi:hypothetical protein
MLNNNNNNISSLDNLFKCLYNSKFNNWLIGKVLRPVIEQDKWHVRSSDMNIQLVFNKGAESKLDFIKGRFHIGLIHIADIEEAAAYQYDLVDYSYKPNLIGHIDLRPVKEDGETYFQVSYLFNFFPEFDLLEYFDRLYDQIEVIKDDIRFRLGTDLMDSINVYNQDLNKDKDKFDDEDEYVVDPDDEDNDNDNSVIIAPYDLGDK